MKSVPKCNALFTYCTKYTNNGTGYALIYILVKKKLHPDGWNNNSTTRLKVHCPNIFTKLYAF